MFKKILMFLVLGMVMGCFSNVFAQSNSVSISKFKVNNTVRNKIGPVASVPHPDLQPKAWISCCNCDSSCSQSLNSSGYMLVQEITPTVFNNGNVKSGKARGAIEFFDYLSNSNKIFRFTVDPVEPGKPGKIHFYSQPKGLFLINKMKGVKVSVTFQQTGLIPKTNTIVEHACGELY